MQDSLASTLGLYRQLQFLSIVKNVPHLQMTQSLSVLETAEEEHVLTLSFFSGIVFREEYK